VHSLQILCTHSMVLIWWWLLLPAKKQALVLQEYMIHIGLTQLMLRKWTLYLGRSSSNCTVHQYWKICSKVLKPPFLNWTSLLYQIEETMNWMESWTRLTSSIDFQHGGMTSLLLYIHSFVGWNGSWQCNIGLFGPHLSSLSLLWWQSIVFF